MLNCCIEKRRKRAIQSIEGACPDSPFDTSPRRMRHGSGDDSSLHDSPSHSAVAASERHPRFSPLMKRNLMRPDSRTSLGIESCSGSDEEFFDCDESQKSEIDMETSESHSSISGTQEMGEKEAVAATEPEGRLRPFGTIKLMNSNESLYIPVTQEPAPMTEDMLEEHAEVLAK